jgi:hypothetical protein
MREARNELVWAFSVRNSMAGACAAVMFGARTLLEDVKGVMMLMKEREGCRHLWQVRMAFPLL